MGPHHSHHHPSFVHHNDGLYRLSGSHSHKDTMQATHKFDATELRLIRETFKELTQHHSHGKLIDHDTFLKYFPLPGLIGERLFKAFDYKNIGAIDYDEFLIGLAVCCRGSWDEKVRFIFNIYDLGGDGFVGREELSTMLNQIPSSVFKFHHQHHQSQSNRSFESMPLTSSGEKSPPLNGISGEIPPPPFGQILQDGGSEVDGGSYNPPNLPPARPQQGIGNEKGHSCLHHHNRLYQFTNEDLVEQVFREFDLNHHGKLSFEQFRSWCTRTPEIVAFLEAAFPFDRELKSGYRKNNVESKRESILPFSKKKSNYLNHHTLSRANSLNEGYFSMRDKGQRWRLNDSASYDSLSVPPERHGMKDPIGPEGGGKERPPFLRQSSLANGSGKDTPVVSRPRSTSMGRNATGSGDFYVQDTHEHGSMTNEDGRMDMQALGAGKRRGSRSSKGSVSGGQGLSSDDDSFDSEGRKSSWGKRRRRRPTKAKDLGDMYDQNGDDVAAVNYLKMAYKCASSSDIRERISALVGALESQLGVAGNTSHDSEACHTMMDDRDGRESCDSRSSYEGFEDPLSDEVIQGIPHIEGTLWKIGHKLRQLKSRFYYLKEHFLYQFHSPEDVEPQGVIFLTGCFVEELEDEDHHHHHSSTGSTHTHAPHHAPHKKGYFGFSISSDEKDTHPRILYCRSSKDRTKWVKALQRASTVIPIEDDFEIGKVIGSGRFSRVCECVRRVDGTQFAVKIICKKKLSGEEKKLLRTEIAILKLVQHPQILRMEAVYESRDFIYIVTELLKGGELFNKICGRARYSEDEARQVIKPLLESVNYLHLLGIVHRDIKPENILVGDDISDCKIADFGLSKVVLPQEVMKMPCGTLSYVAPEVLAENGYGKEADVWSVGVIMFLLLRGKLPFDGKTKNEIIQSTINANLLLDEKWSTLSSDARELVSLMLAKDPKRRCTASQALGHKWLSRYEDFTPPATSTD